MYNFDEEPDLNITPFVDVMLVLMAILMVTAPTITFQEKIDLPQGTQTSTVEKKSSITIRIDKNRVIYLGKDHYSFRNFRDNFMLKSKKFNFNSTVYIRADENLYYKDVMNLLKVVKDIGFSKVSLITL